MTLVTVLPWIAGFGLVVGLAALTARDGALPREAWRVPAGLSLLFLLWSLAAAIVEGPLGFWPEHVRNMWGNQIWFDLLLAAGVAYALLLPRARAVGMQPWLWLVLVVCSGSIGLLAAVARLLYLESRRPA